MSRLLSFVLFMCATGMVLTQCSTQAETTHWTGYVTQEDDFAYANRYKSTMRFTRRGEILVGENYFSVSKNDTVYVRFSFEGIIDSDTIRLKETGILEATRKKGEWYTKDITLYFDNKEKTVLKGKWTAHRNPAAVGRVHYEINR